MLPASCLGPQTSGTRRPAGLPETAVHLPILYTILRFWVSLRVDGKPLRQTHPPFAADFGHATPPWHSLLGRLRLGGGSTGRLPGSPGAVHRRGYRRRVLGSAHGGQPR